MEIQILSHSSEETRTFGLTLAQRLEPGDIICMHGVLGSGKTTLVQGVAEGLGVEDLVTSPSFTLANEYEGRIPLYHIDLYRIEDQEEFEMLDFDGYLYGKGVTFIEWSEKIEELLTVPFRLLEIGINSDGLRSITLREKE
jgi:tRNA threonylcarbamoyladenosine biosynthesis protein TsaE